MFQYHYNLLPKVLHNFFARVSSKRNNYNSRLALKSTHYIDHFKTNYGKFNLHFFGPSNWNKLDEELKSFCLRSLKQTMT